MLNIRNNPKLKNMTFMKSWKQIVFFAVGLFGLTALQIAAQYVMAFAAGGVYGFDTIDYRTFLDSATATMIINGVAYVGVLTAFVILSIGDLQEIFKSFHGWKPFVAGLIGFASIIGFNIIYSTILTTTGIVSSTNANEQTVQSIVIAFPLASLLIIGAIGPICEELTYRVGLFSFFRRINVILAYFVTMVVFAFIHFQFSSSDIVNELLNLPYYAFAAFVFCFLYEQYGFASSLTAHIVNNTYSVLSILVTHLFK